MSINAEAIKTRIANLSLLSDKYKDRLETFPMEKGWMTENLYKYEGFWHPSNTMLSVETVMAAQETFQANPTDIYLASLPKTGTTWLMSLVFSIVNRKLYQNEPISNNPSLKINPLLKNNPHKVVPYIEIEVVEPNPTYVDGHSPRIFATHIPYNSLPKSILDSGCRLVYMSRNPKDVLISLLHFANKIRDESRSLITIEEAFEMFSKGVTPTGPYWDHVKGYYKAGLEHPTKMLFLTYENMTLDIVNNVKRLAEFLGYGFTEEEEAAGVVEEIVRLCSFENLSEVNKHGNLGPGVPNSAFFREGKVGDWSNHLTTEMSETLDKITKEKFQGLDISF